MSEALTNGRKVLLITADQWRGDTLGAVGHPVVRTPNLDSLARDGTLFARHFAQASPCGPARACLLTGRYLMNHRTVGNGTPLDARHTNIALEARRAGYDPTLFGYTDTTVDPRGLPPSDPRLRTYEGVLPGMTAGLVVPEDAKPWLAHLRARGYGDLTAETAYRPQEGALGDRGVTFAPAAYGADDSDTAFVVGEALRWLSVRAGEPWFLHLSLLRPHPPWIAPEPYNALYDPAAMPRPVRAADRTAEGAQHPFLDWLLGFLPREQFFPDGAGPASAASERDTLQARATYCGLMTEVDHHLGRLFDFLKASGQWDDTLIVFTSDHGEHLGDHHLFGKLGYFDQAMHIPLIVRDPSRDGGHGRQVDRFTESVDVLPTVLEWLGVPVPAVADGDSLMPFLHGGEPPRWRDAVHWELDFRNPIDLAAETALGLRPDQCSLAVLRDERRKYVHFAALPPLFFDLEADPAELTNLAARPDRSSEMLAYAGRLLSWRMIHADRELANHRAGPDGMVVWQGPRY